MPPLQYVVLGGEYDSVLPYLRREVGPEPVVVSHKVRVGGDPEADGVGLPVEVEEADGEDGAA